MDRRSLLLAVSGALATLGSARLPGGSRPRPHIDVHHHVFPPQLREVLSTRWPAAELADESRSLEAMRRAGTSRAVISFPNSDIATFEEDALTTLIRVSNDYVADLVHQYPNQYSFFASLPMPYVEASLREIDRIASKGVATGVTLITNYGTRRLGDRDFVPVMDELNRRKLVAYVHPNAAHCCRAA